MGGTRRRVTKNARTRRRRNRNPNGDEKTTREEHGVVWCEAAQKLKAAAGDETTLGTGNLMLVVALGLACVGKSYLDTPKE